MIVVVVSGYRDSGKTTLVERLVPALTERGRVATVKSIHHDVEVDTPGKDTHRHRTAGADAVVGLTPSLTFAITVEDRADDPESRLDRGLAHLAHDEYDYVVAEGFKATPVPTILVGDISREAVAGEVLARVPGGREADVDSLVASIDALSPYRPD
ncbi:MAG: molybdopterin-guanine dinucleotide biosynthesis protein B [Halanaeroarchaeum sp.]